jgi:hypothetical protein
MQVILKIKWNSCVVIKHNIEWTCLLSAYALQMNYTLVKNKKGTICKIFSQPNYISNYKIPELKLGGHSRGTE